MTPEAVQEAPRAAVQPVKGRRAQQDPAWVRWTLTASAIGVVGLLVVVPVVNVFAEAFADGVRAYWNNLFGDPDTRHSIYLTLIVVPSAVAANIVFGFAAAWAIARFNFPGRTLLTSLIDLPFAVSPVVAGLMFVLIFGRQGYVGAFLRRDGYSIMPYATSLALVLVLLVAYYFLRPSNPSTRRGFWAMKGPAVIAAVVAVFVVSVVFQKLTGIWPSGKSLKIIYSTPGLILATAFVTFPFVARELIPVMEAIGPDEEMAAVSLGANGWQMFWHITLPNIKWGLAYGVILCNARSMG